MKALRAELETRDIGELVEMLKQYGPLHNQTDITSRKRIIRAIEIAKFQIRGQRNANGSFSR